MRDVGSDYHPGEAVENGTSLDKKCSPILRTARPSATDTSKMLEHVLKNALVCSNICSNSMLQYSGPQSRREGAYCLKMNCDSPGS